MGRTRCAGRFCVAAMAAMLPLMAASQAQAENENFSNKPAPALFNADCTGSGCHKSPAGLGKNQSQSGLAGFLREHYTNSRESAAALAAYILKMPAGAAPPPEAKPTRASTQRPGEREPRSGSSWFDPEPSGPPEARPGNARQQQQEKEKEREKAKPPTRAAARPPEAKPAEPKPGESKPAEAKPAEGEEPSAAATPAETPAEPATPADRRRRVAEPEPKPVPPAPRNQRGRQPTVAATPAPAEPAPPPAPAAPPPPQYDIFD